MPTGGEAVPFVPPGGPQVWLEAAGPTVGCCDPPGGLWAAVGVGYSGPLVVRQDDGSHGVTDSLARCGRGMASQRHSKKEGSLKDLFNKTPAKRAVQSGAPEMEGGEAAGTGPSVGDGAPLMKAFIEQLFGSLHEDFATQKQEIAVDIKELKREVVNLGQRVDTLEETHDAQEEKLDCHRRELLPLQDKNQELQYQLEDLENRYGHSNILIKGI
ncbi:hypothetical protein NDU88_001388 [Pleurodeles waltl]|uniref:Uncharacterized protein n=1 Tax=Pleurodeles waltl TaxID=8319 RepID=A0AAV7UTW6_PLEWA|nr:hypothetical protein NDU88_001388 [Pleurodeles waltl]